MCELTSKDVAADVLLMLIYTFTLSCTYLGGLPVSLYLFPWVPGAGL